MAAGAWAILLSAGPASLRFRRPSFTTRPHLAANGRLPVPNPRRCCPSMPARNGLSAAQRSRMEFLGGTIAWAKALIDAAYLKQLRDLPTTTKGRKVFLGPFKVLVV